MIKLWTLLLAFICIATYTSHGQNVGVRTNSPDAPFHVSSSGQVQTPGGLLLLGHRPEAHMELDFNRIQSLFGQSSNNTLDLQLQPDGGDIGIGIGTTNPNGRLHIGGTSDQFLTLHRTTFGLGQVGINLLRSSEFNSTDWRIVNDGGAFKILDAIDNFQTPGDLNLYIGTTGNVGLGTDNPQDDLHVAGNDNQFLILQRTTGGAGMVGIDLLRDNEFGATDWRIVNDGGVLKFLDETDNFNTVGEENMRISQSGNVGVGTTSPHTKLHVDGGEFISETGEGDMQIGSGTGTHLRFDNNEILARSGDNPSTLFLQYWGGNLNVCAEDAGKVGIGMSPSSSGPKVQIGFDGWQTEYQNTGDGSTNDWFVGASQSSWTVEDNKLVFSPTTNSSAATMIMDNGGDVLLNPYENGQVGIGITKPSNMPDDQYLLAVDGKAIIEEVRVELSGSWPDYVFAPEYELTTLQVLEHQIKTLGHLPGIPAAETIEDEGFDLGDMQSRMMEKIEELTLYMIQANKEIEKLKATNESLQSEIDALK